MKDLVVGIGEILWDDLPEGKQLGGAPANFAFHVGQFGVPSVVVSAVGQDDDAAALKEAAAARKLDCRLAAVDFPTGVVGVKLDEQGKALYDIRSNAAWDNIPFTDELAELAKRTSAVCFGTLAQRSEVSRNSVRRFLEAMTRKDALKVFDINLRQNYYSHDTITESLRLCNVLKINDEELDVLTPMLELGDTTPQNRCWTLLGKYGLKTVILTCGEKGSYVFTPGHMTFESTPKVKLADTVGAGDSFTAAFIASILKGATPAEAHAKAAETAAYVCEQKGAMPKLPSKITGKSLLRKIFG